MRQDDESEGWDLVLMHKVLGFCSSWIFCILIFKTCIKIFFILSTEGFFLHALRFCTQKLPHLPHSGLPLQGEP